MFNIDFICKDLLDGKSILIRDESDFQEIISGIFDYTKNHARPYITGSLLEWIGYWSELYDGIYLTCISSRVLYGRFNDEDIDSYDPLWESSHYEISMEDNIIESQSEIDMLM